MPTIASIWAAAVAVAVLTFSPRVVAPQGGSRCSPSDDAHASGFIAYARNLITNPRFSASRESIGVPTTRREEIAFVQTDSLCAKAAAVVNRDRGHSGSGTQMVYLLRVGALYWVEDPTYKAGEYIRGLVLDSTLTTIVGRPGR